MHFVFCFANFFSESRIKEKIRLIEAVASDPELLASLSVFVLDNSSSFSWNESSSILVDSCNPGLNLGYIAAVLVARNSYLEDNPFGCAVDDLYFVLGNSDLDYLNSLSTFLKRVSLHGNTYGVYAPVIVEKALDGRLHAAVFKSNSFPNISLFSSLTVAIKAFVFMRPVVQMWPLLDELSTSDYSTSYIHGCFLCFSPSFMKNFPSTVPLFMYGEETIVSYLLSRYSSTALVLRSCVMLHANEGPASNMSRLNRSLLYFSQNIILRSVMINN